MIVASDSVQPVQPAQPAQHRASALAQRGLSSSATLGWLLALAISSRALYPEPIQIALFVLFFAYVWSMPSLRRDTIAATTEILKLLEGRLLILLLVCSLIATVSATAKGQPLTIWIDFSAFLIFVLASCSCLSLLGQSNHSVRRIFRMVTIGFTISMLMWFALLVIVLVVYYQKIDIFGKDYLFSWFDYLLYSQAGLPVIFFPLLFAAFSRHGIGLSGIGLSGIGLSTDGNSRLFWRVCISIALLLFLLVVIKTERQVIALASLVAAIVATVALFDKNKVNRRLVLLATLCILCSSVLLVYYLYNNAQVYRTNGSELCAECNELFLPVWLVDNVRQFAWRETITVWLQNPWFGRGVHNDLTSFHHPHSRFLQILSGFGIVGFSVFAALLLLLVARAFSQWRKQRKLSYLSMLLVHSVYWSIGAFELSVWSVWHFWLYICALVLSLALDRLPIDRLPMEKGSSKIATNP